MIFVIHHAKLSSGLLVEGYRLHRSTNEHESERLSCF